MQPVLKEFWKVEPEQLLTALNTTDQGLNEGIVQERLASRGIQALRGRKRFFWIIQLLNQFRSPIILILLFAAGLSIYLHSNTDAYIILTIVFVSGLLGFWQEKGAAEAVDKLLALVQVRVDTLRKGKIQQIPQEEVVPGDIIVLSAGAAIPGDCLLLESDNLYVDEAALTGETYPVEKKVGILEGDISLAKRTNSVFMGTHVVSGTGKGVVVKTGLETEFGEISTHLEEATPETEFERGVRRFGYLLMEVTLLLVIAIFAINVYLARPVLESFLFSLALAVGLTPQLLPAIISINLATGAKKMAAEQVIVKRLSSIENFGSMNVLCSDKTGTLTEGEVRIKATLDMEGRESDKVLLYSYLNATFESGFANPIDKAIRDFRQFSIQSYTKLGEVPYDFVRKQLSILVAATDKVLMITKGAFDNVLQNCSSVEKSDGTIVGLEEQKEAIIGHYRELSGQGFRTLGVAYKTFGQPVSLTKEHEKDMVFLGFIVLYDPPKEGIVDTISRLRQMGVELKVITGDNRLVAENLGRQLGLANTGVITGGDLHKTSDAALGSQLRNVDVFAEIEPNQKERIIMALRKAGNVVGYIGDGINDASALHAADVGISVESAVDVAKDAADLVLLKKDLKVLENGVREGRITFANTMKYVFMATSANFGNMFSMAAASLFLPFIPLLPKQILLTNLLTDFPEMTISTDKVDRELVEKPRRWDLAFIRKFMITFGLLSSAFDILTFILLRVVVKANVEQFRTGWFIESVVSASLIVLVIRTRKPLHTSKPSWYLSIATAAVVVVTCLLPFTPLAGLLGFAPLSAKVLGLIGGIVIVYVLTAEVMKKLFYSHAS